jgi:hypothetical protein
MAKHRPVNY